MVTSKLFQNFALINLKNIPIKFFFNTEDSLETLVIIYQMILAKINHTPKVN